MKLKDFIEKFVEPNTLIRLWYKIGEGHEQINDGKSEMEWKLLKKSTFLDNEVIGVTDIILLGSNDSEAVNIVIKR
jgi:hypothetical protein